MIALLAAAAAAAAQPLHLDALLDEVGRRAPQIRTQQESVAAARAGVGLAGAFPDPAITVMAEDIPLHPSDPDASTTMVTYRMLFRLDPIFGRRGLSRSAARGSLGAQEALLRRAGWDARAQAVTLFWELWMNREMRDLVDRQLELLRGMERSATARYAAGLPMAHHDVLRAQAESARMEAERATLSEERQAIAAMLNVLRGRPRAEDPGEPEVGARDVVPELAAVLGVASLRPELQQARAMRDEAEARVGLARRTYLPMVMVGGGYQQFTGGMPDALMAEVGLTVPLFWFERQASELEMARAMERRALREVELMEAMTDAELRMAWSRARGADRELAALEETALPRMREAVQSARSSYTAGTGDFLSLLDSAMSLLETDAERIRAAARRAVALYELQRIAGSGAAGGAP